MRKLYINAPRTATIVKKLTPPSMCVGMAVLLMTQVASGQVTFTYKFTFDDGLTPPTSTVRANNPGAGATNAGGIYGTGCMILTTPASGETYGHWAITNDLGFGNIVDAFEVRFALYMGNGSGGNAGVPNAGGNGLILHLGPVPPAQYTGSASSWGNGLDVVFRTYNSGINTAGINIGWDPVSDVFRPGAGTLIAKTNFLGYFQTNKPASRFELPTWVWMVVTNSRLSLVCSNEAYGEVTVYTNVELQAYAGIRPFQVTFTASDGSGAHEDAWVDEVTITITKFWTGTNSGSITRAPEIVISPVDLVVREGEMALFSGGARGTLPLTFQWYSNGVPVPGATEPNYLVPTTTVAMDNSIYRFVVTNAFGMAASSNAILRVVRQPVEIIAQPKDQIVPVDARAIFSVEVDPNVLGPIQYQWWQVSPLGITNPVQGGTNSILYTDALKMSDSGSGWFAVINGPLNVVTSSVAYVTVLDAAQVHRPVFANDNSLELRWLPPYGCLEWATNILGPWFSWLHCTNGLAYIQIAQGVPQQFFRVRQFGQPAPVRDYTPYVNVVQNANGLNNIYRTALLRYPYGRVGFWSIDAGEFADSVTRCVRVYPCLGEPAFRDRTNDWRQTITGTPARVYIIYKTNTPACGSALEATVTHHVTLYRVTFPQSQLAKLLMLFVKDEQIGKLNWTSNTVQIIDNRTVEIILGRSNTTLRAYCFVQFDRPCSRFGVTVDDRPSWEQTFAVGQSVGGVFEFDSQCVTAAVGLSHTSMAEARNHVASECADLDLDAAAVRLHRAWITTLGKVEAEGSELRLRQLYTALYTVYANIIDVSDNPNYSGYKPLLTVSSSDYWQYVGGYLRCSWDNSRATYALLALIDPELFTHILNTYLVQYAKDGRFWGDWCPYGLNRSGGSGTWAQNIALLALRQKVQGVDYVLFKNAAKATILNHREFLTNGYRSYPEDNCASRTLEHCPQVQALAILAKMLGDIPTYATFYPHRKNFLHLWDPGNLQFRARYADGQFAGLGQGFFEGDGIDYRFMAPHDPYTLLGLYDAQNADAVNLISNYVALRSDYNDYQLIYGMLPMFSDRADVTQWLVRSVHVPKFEHLNMAEGYWPGPKGCYYSSNAGALACWLLGLYWIHTSGATWLLTTPSFDRVTIHGATELTVQTVNNTPSNNYICSISLDNALYPALQFSGATLVSANHIVEVVLTNTPTRPGFLYLSSTDGELLDARGDGQSWLEFDLEPMAMNCQLQVYCASVPTVVLLNGKPCADWVYNSTNKLLCLSGAVRGTYRFELAR